MDIYMSDKICPPREFFPAKVTEKKLIIKAFLGVRNSFYAWCFWQRLFYSHAMLVPITTVRHFEMFQHLALFIRPKKRELHKSLGEVKGTLADICRN